MNTSRRQRAAHERIYENARECWAQFPDEEPVPVHAEDMVGLLRDGGWSIYHRPVLGLIPLLGDGEESYTAESGRMVIMFISLSYERIEQERAALAEAQELRAASNRAMLKAKRQAAKRREPAPAQSKQALRI